MKYLLLLNLVLGIVNLTIFAASVVLGATSYSSLITGLLGVVVYFLADREVQEVKIKNQGDNNGIQR